MKCPVCSTPLAPAGRTFKCETCNGAWVQAEVLVPMLEQSAATLVELAWQDNIEPHLRKCPGCGLPMQTVKLGTVALDRCEPHGVWFDAKELAGLLGQAKKFRAEPQAHEGLLHLLHRITRH